MTRGAVLLLALGLGACAGRGVTAPTAEVRPGAAPGSLAAADRLCRTGREADAIDAYAARVAAEPDSVRAHLSWVASLLSLGRRSEARAIYARRSARPDARSVDRVMAMRLATDGSSSALRRVYTWASEQEPDSPWWRLAITEVEISEAEAWGRKREEAIERGDREEEQAAYDQARAALDRGQRALDHVATRAGPLPAEVDLYQGLLRAVEGDLHHGAVAKKAAYGAAEDALTRAVQHDRNLVEAWEGLGDVRLRRGEVREGLRAFREAVELAPADAHLRISLGVALQRAERYGEAAAQYGEAARLAPRDADPWIRIGDARAAEEKWDAALEAWAEALRRDGEAVDAWYRQATVLEHLERPGEARVAYERYLSQGGERSSTVRRRVERILRAEEGPR